MIRILDYVYLHKSFTANFDIIIDSRLPDSVGAILNAVLMDSILPGLRYRLEEKVSSLISTPFNNAATLLKRVKSSA